MTNTTAKKQGCPCPKPGRQQGAKPGALYVCHHGTLHGYHNPINELTQRINRCIDKLKSRHQ